MEGGGYTLENLMQVFYNFSDKLFCFVLKHFVTNISFFFFFFFFFDISDIILKFFPRIFA